MKHNHTLLTSAVALALCSVGNLAQAASGVAYSGTGGKIPIKLTNNDPTVLPTILRKLTVTCPKAGHLVATGTAGFSIDGDEFQPGMIHYDITRDKPTFDTDHGYDVKYKQIIRVGLPSGEVLNSEDNGNPGFLTTLVVPGSIQRTFTCKQGKSHTFYFIAEQTRAGDPVEAVASHPKLVVEFFDVKI